MGEVFVQIPESRAWPTRVMGRLDGILKKVWKIRNKPTRKVIQVLYLIVVFNLHMLGRVTEMVALQLNAMLMLWTEWSLREMVNWTPPFDK